MLTELETKSIQKNTSRNIVSVILQSGTRENYVSMPSFSDYLREKLIIHGWKPIELANHSGLARGSISKYLNLGEKPERESIVKLAKAFGVPEQEVMDAVEGRYKPLSKAELDAIEINKKYLPEAIRLAAQFLQEYDLEDLQAIAREVRAERQKKSPS